MESLPLFFSLFFAPFAFVSLRSRFISCFFTLISTTPLLLYFLSISLPKPLRQKVRIWFWRKEFLLFCSACFPPFFSNVTILPFSFPLCVFIPIWALRLASLALWSGLYDLSSPTLIKHAVIVSGHYSISFVFTILAAVYRRLWTIFFSENLYQSYLEYTSLFLYPHLDSISYPTIAYENSARQWCRHVSLCRKPEDAKKSTIWSHLCWDLNLYRLGVRRRGSIICIRTF